MKLQKRIATLADCFEYKERGEEVITILKDDAPEELKKAIYEAHGDRLPDDFIYRQFDNILKALEGYTIKSIDDVEENRSEIVDGLVDCYTSRLTKWLNSHSANAEYLDMAVNEYEARENILVVAQYIAIDEIYGHVINLLNQ